MNPTGTLFAGLGVTQIADIITWLSTWPVTAPPQNVSMAVAALIFAGAHMAVSVFNNRKAPIVAAPVVVAPVPVVTPPAP